MQTVEMAVDDRRFDNKPFVKTLVCPMHRSLFLVMINITYHLEERYVLLVANQRNCEPLALSPIFKTTTVVGS